jgi:hypothetical protein
LEIDCYIVYDKDEIVGRFDEKTLFFDWDETRYYVASYTKNKSGYKNVKLLDEATVSRLLVLYVKTYELTEEQFDELNNEFHMSGLLAVKEKVDKWFKKAEEDQHKENQNSSKIDPDELAKIGFGEKNLTMNVLFTEAIEKLKFEELWAYTLIDDYVYVNGSTYVVEAKRAPDGVEEKEYQINLAHNGSGIVYFLCVDDPNFKFYKGINTDMDKESIIALLGSAATIVEGEEHDYIILEADDIKMTIVCDANGSDVKHIYMIHELFYEGR